MYLRMDVDVRAFLRFTYTHTYIRTYMDVHGQRYRVPSVEAALSASLSSSLSVRTIEREAD